jgi:hypothetical protein
VLNNQGTGTAATILSGIDWVVSNYKSYGITVINLSVSITGDAAHPICTSIASAVSKGLVVVASAGGGAVGSVRRRCRVVVFGVWAGRRREGSAGNSARTRAGRGTAWAPKHTMLVLCARRRKPGGPAAGAGGPKCCGFELYERLRWEWLLLQIMGATAPPSTIDVACFC